MQAYEPLPALPNVRSFVKQVKAFHLFVSGMAARNPPRDGSVAHRQADLADAGLAIALGKCLATIAYAQLVAENCVAAEIEPAIVSVFFHSLIEDLSAEALKLSALYLPGGAQRDQLRDMVRVPQTDAENVQAVAEFMAARYRVAK